MKQNIEWKTEEEVLLQNGVHSDIEDLVVFRWLDQQISNKKAITACLLVLQGSACTGAPLDVNRVVGT